MPSPNFNNRPAGQVIDSIVIHTVEGGYASGLAELTNPLIEKSAHYIISPTGEIAQLVALDKRAWHANYYNDRSIGIEMAGFAGQASTWNTQNPAALVDLVAYLAQKYSIPIVHPSGDAGDFPNCLFNSPGFIAHSQIQPGCNGFDFRSDPGPHFPWPTFIRTVQTIVSGGEQE